MKLSTAGSLARCLAVASLCLAVVACGGDDDDAPSSSSTVDDGSDGTTTTEAEPTPTSALPTPPSLAGGVGLFHDSEMTSCSTEPGPVEAVGTTTNAGADAADIVVRVTWVTVEGSHVLVRNFEVFEDVPAGETVEWTITADLPAELVAEQPVECALNVQRGTL